jgi:hypothetical protein
MSKRNSEQFVMIFTKTLDSPAWRAMSHGARSLFIALKRRYYPDRHNNGRLFLSYRDAVVELGSSNSEIARWFRELRHYGFIVEMVRGHLGVDGEGKATTWRLTDVGYMKEAPTYDFRKWNGVKFGKSKKASAPETDSRSGKPERFAPEIRSTHAPENRSGAWNNRSGKPERVGGEPAPENRSTSSIPSAAPAGPAPGPRGGTRAAPKARSRRAGGPGAVGAGPAHGQEGVAGGELDPYAEQGRALYDKVAFEHASARGPDIRRMCRELYPGLDYPGQQGVLRSYGELARKRDAFAAPLSDATPSATISVST